MLLFLNQTRWNPTLYYFRGGLGMTTKWSGGKILTRWQHGLQPWQTPSRPGQTSGTFARSQNCLLLRRNPSRPGDAKIRTRWQHGLQPRQTPSRPGQTSGTFGRWHHGLLPLQAPLRLSQTLGNRKLFAHYVPEIHLSLKHVDVSCRVCSWNSCMFGLLMLSVIFSEKQ